MKPFLLAASGVGTLPPTRTNDRHPTNPHSLHVYGWPFFVDGVPRVVLVVVTFAMTVANVRVAVDTAVDVAVVARPWTWEERSKGHWTGTLVATRHHNELN